MAENKVSVEITLEEKAALKALTQLTKDIQKTEGAFNSLGKEGDESLGVLGQATDGVRDGFKSLVAGVTVANLASTAIMGAANAIKNFALGSINAAIEAENSQNRLAQALRATNSFSEEAVSDFNSYAGALAQVSVYGDDAILSQIAIAKSMGATNAQSKELVKAAAELAATFGGSLEERVQQLGKTLSGTAGKLAQTIPGFKNLTEEQLRNGEAIDLINRKYDGSAATQLETYGGKLAQLTKSFGELQEAIGLLVVNSGAADAFGAIATQINLMTQAMNDNEIASQRAAGGFTETSSSLEQLKRQLDETRVKATDLEQSILNPAMNMDGTAIFIAKKQLAELNGEIAATQALIAQASPQVKAGIDTANTQGTGAGATIDQARVDKEAETLIAIQALKEQARLAEEEQKALFDAQKQTGKDLEIEQIYAFEAQKLEAQFQAEEAKTRLIKDSDERSLKLKEVNAKRELEFTKLGNAQIRAENQRKVKDQEAINGHMLATASNFLAAGQLLAKEGSAAQKAMQITQATINTYAAATNALAQPVPPPVAAAMAASMIALGLANVAKIAGAKFEHGGIVPGNSMTGDKIHAQVNSGEMILNRQQQGNLFNMVNSGGSGGNNDNIAALIKAIMDQPIVISVDGRVLASVVRREVQSGFRLN